MLRGQSRSMSPSSPDSRAQHDSDVAVMLEVPRNVVGLNVKLVPAGQMAALFSRRYRNNTPAPLS